VSSLLGTVEEEQIQALEARSVPTLRFKVSRRRNA
jgi:hypothetical protein